MRMHVITDASGEVVVALQIPDAQVKAGVVVGIEPTEKGQVLHEIEAPKDLMSLSPEEFRVRVKGHLRK